MTGPEHDAELEAFLKRRSPMHRRLSDIDHAEPSLELDRLVLNRAREAIDTPGQPLFRSSRWALPAGLAASILIAFTVVLNLDRHSPDVAKPLASSVSPAAEAQAPAVARAAPVRDAAPTAPRVLSDTAEKRSDAPAPLAKRQSGSETPGVADAAASSAHLIASSGALAGSVPAPSPPAPQSGAAARREAVTTTTAAASTASPGAAKRADPHSSPDSWLREINRLRAAGRTADADRELAAFREAYPTHPAYAVAKPPAR